MSKEERSEERKESRGLLYKLDKWMNGWALRGVGTAEVISNEQHFNIRFLNTEIL